ncbi:molybdate ABC transporter permease subunit [Pontibacillus litoralis]|uniref:Molybdenum transport system permease n=1 Tax=Pontibacillus litoralis JSM 072002 TaxID=1385512 RepID=A0A0A5FZA3_9BACI|nr:molybdate ABC transporter permease subunit [Pontibacillus litoralis]KGX85124.1 molybdenum ABC transporter permease [Pontibacillus litoralis JSM 072002]
MNTSFWSPIYLSLTVSFVATVAVFILGTMLALVLSRVTFKGKMIIETIVMLPIVLPPSVIGFMLIVLFGTNSSIGQLITFVFGQSILFTWWAAVIAAGVVAFPLMYNSAKLGFQQVDQQVEEAARVDGATEKRVFLYVTLPLAKHALFTGGILSLARAFGEFGATLMFAGNIPGKTQTIPTAIYVAMDSGDMSLAWLYVGVSIGCSVIMLALTYVFQRPEHS